VRNVLPNGRPYGEYARYFGSDILAEPSFLTI